MKYKIGDLLEDGIGELWIVMGIKWSGELDLGQKYVLQKCDNIRQTWEDYVAYADHYKHLTKVS